MKAPDGRVVADDQTDGSQVPYRADPDHAASENSRPIAIDRAAGAPAFLTRDLSSRDLGSRDLGFGLHPHTPEVSRRQSLLEAIAARLDRLRHIWRSHLERDASNMTAPRRTGGIGGGVFALLSLLVITTCVGGLVALTQIKSLKAEIASLQREMLPLRERLASYELAEKVRMAELKAAAEKNKALAENLSKPAPLTFSREEAQLIREYIKPAPFAGPAAPAINVGDPVAGGTIPLPSALTDKMPRLVGARFAIRNGAIMIVRRDSQKVDAVLPAY